METNFKSFKKMNKEAKSLGHDLIEFTLKRYDGNIPWDAVVMAFLVTTEGLLEANDLHEPAADIAEIRREGMDQLRDMYQALKFNRERETQQPQAWKGQ